MFDKIWHICLVLKLISWSDGFNALSFGTGDHAELIVQPPSIDLGPDEADKDAVSQRHDSPESKKSEVLFSHNLPISMQYTFTYKINPKKYFNNKVYTIRLLFMWYVYL